MDPKDEERFAAGAAADGAAAARIPVSFEPQELGAARRGAGRRAVLARPLPLLPPSPADRARRALLPQASFAAAAPSSATADALERRTTTFRRTASLAVCKRCGLAGLAGLCAGGSTGHERAAALAPAQPSLFLCTQLLFSGPAASSSSKARKGVPLVVLCLCFL